VWEWDGTIWTDRTPPPQPAVRIQASSTYDLSGQRTILFGGYDGTAALRDTWSWDGNFWTRLTSPSDPPARDRPALSSDDAGHVVLFGGTPNGIDALGDVWQLDGSTWTEHMPTVAPIARWASGFTYDGAHARWILFGGRGAAGALGDTWTWDGAAWTELHPAHAPAARSGVTLSYDQDRHVVVAFAGKDDTLLASREIWEWDGIDWTDRTQATAGPPPPTNVQSMYDAQLHRTLFLMTPGSVSGLGNEVWAWDGTDWSNVPVDVAPSLYEDFALSYDRVRKRGVLFGSDLPEIQIPFASTWELYGRGAPCANDAEATTGHCVDGVACEVPACTGVCESCNVEGAVGRCAPVVLDADPDTCTGAQTCDAAGACKAVLGQPVATPADCASGFLVDGVCCETESCGFCSTCNAALKEIGDNNGRCGTQRAGTDLRDECAATAPETCGFDGVCDGRGICEKHVRGTACGKDAICTGAGECVLQTAVCDGEGAVRAANGKVTSCAGFRCLDGACRATCSTVDDCVSGSDCTGAGQCLPASNDDSDAAGCSCDVPGGVPPRSGLFLGLFALVLGSRRKRAAKSANWS
jgi:hypothetical protein